MVLYGLNIANEREISAKASNKKDGVYRFRGVVYRVRAGRVTHWAANGDVLENFGNFNVKVGICEANEGGGIRALKAI
jgi:hypothetical protein